jgi:hypothetical protein
VAAPAAPDTPLLVFINAKSGGNLGARLAAILYRALGYSQVVRWRAHPRTCHRIHWP